MHTKHDSFDFHFHFEQKTNLTAFIREIDGARYTFPLAIWALCANTQPRFDIKGEILTANCIYNIYNRSQSPSAQTKYTEIPKQIHKNPKPNTQKSQIKYIQNPKQNIQKCQTKYTKTKMPN